MKVPENLANGFGADFEKQMIDFCVEKKLLPDNHSLQSNRFISRSILPHILKLSGVFNREDRDPSSGLEPYWKESSNPAHLRLAYFLYYMPANLYRVASVWAELGRLGFKWPFDGIHAVEFGAGPASGACGIAAGSFYSNLKLPKQGTWALIEQDKAMLELGSEWARAYSDSLNHADWDFRKFHRKMDLASELLPRRAPQFQLWLMSFFLNEFEQNENELASLLLRTWDQHLEQEGLVILVEPALRLQSRKLLALRKALLLQLEKKRSNNYQILLPCLGHQKCGAFEDPEDWCHEEVTWWRPPYFKKIDQMASLDRRTLPFSYLVIAKSSKAREEILPELKQKTAVSRQRLVSPAHKEGKELEFYICGEEGKRKARYRPRNDEDPGKGLQRGDILLGSEIRGDKNSSRVDKIDKLV